MITLVDPKKELLISRHEDSSSVWPISMITRSCLHLILTSEEEVPVNQILRLPWGHARVAVEFTSQITFKSCKHLLHKISNFEPCLLGSTWVQGEHLQVSGGSNPGGNDLRLRCISKTGGDLFNVHIGDVLHGSISLVALVVHLNDRVEELLVVSVRLQISSMATNKRAWIARACVDGSGKGPSGRCGLVVLQLFPQLFSHNLRH
mmetsp:Transcript_103461/g.178238  ORF Transcript_103461/g.178238 Transcript_103461/m.178238 type:complete len:205 (-) Transcript_103461:137-751(-)